MKRTPHVLFLSPSSYYGGGQRWLQVLANGLARILDYRVSIAFMAGHPGTMFHQALRPYLVRQLCYRLGEPTLAADVGAYIDGEAVDVLIVERDDGLYQLRQTSKRLQEGKTQVVFVCHTMGQPVAKQAQILAPLLSAIVAVSEKVAALVRQYVHGVQVCTIRNSVPPPPRMGLNVREFLGIPNNAFTIGYIGRMQGLKHPELVIEVAKQEGWCALLVGTGEQTVMHPTNPRPALGLNGVWIWNTPVWAVGDWYSAMDVFVLASTTEGFPLAPMEAWLSHTRVAMTPVSDYPQIFSRAAAFFPPGDPSRCAQAVRQAPPPEIGQEIIAAYPPEAMVRAYHELFEEVRR